MRYIFVDESRITQARFQLFGSLWLEDKRQGEFRKGFWRLWDQHFPTRASELKWTKVSKNKLSSYQKFIDFFWRFPLVDFRCVVLDKHAMEYQEYHQGDEELGLYKFLYFFISRNIEKDYHYKLIKCPYQIFMDSRRRDNEVGRLNDLRVVLNRRLDDICISTSQPVVRRVDAVLDSKLSPEIQITDVLLGAVGYVWEGFQTSPAKLALVDYIQTLLDLRLDCPTPYLTDKFNIWNFEFKQKQKSAPLPIPRIG